MNDTIAHALATERTIDITSTGHRSGQPSRIEIWFHVVDDVVYLTGSPGRRDWYANLLANPSFTFHLKESVVVDLAARATPITDRRTKRSILAVIHDRVNSSKTLDDWVENSPLVAVDFV